MAEPAPQALVTGFSGALMNVVARFWILRADPARQRSLVSAVTLAIRAALQREGVAFAPPTPPAPAPALPPATQARPLSLQSRASGAGAVELAHGGGNCGRSAPR